MKLTSVAPLLFVVIFPSLPHRTLASSSSSDSKAAKPCTIHSSGGSYYDLSPLTIHAVDNDGKKSRKDDGTESWHARGYDYPANFTLNFCAPVVEELEDVVGVDKKLWGNVSAYYEAGGKVYSIGQGSSTPIFRGRKLVLNYTDGSPCDSASSRSADKRSPDPSPKLIDDDDDDDDKNDRAKKPQHSNKGSSGGGSSSTHRKSTIISLLCDSKADSSKPKASVAFIGASPDECAYFFEVRSSAACGGHASEGSSGLGPGGVFGIIALIAIVVYLLGGCAYQRTVMHQRGWRQLPNYSMWASIASFFKDFVIIVFSSLSRLIPTSLFRGRGSGRRGGYSHLSISADAENAPGNGHVRSGDGRGGRPGRPEDENRLIDQLDEEWDD